MNPQLVEVMYLVVLSTARGCVPPVSHVLLSSSQCLRIKHPHKVYKMLIALGQP